MKTGMRIISAGGDETDSFPAATGLLRMCLAPMPDRNPATHRGPQIAAQALGTLATDEPEPVTLPPEAGWRDFLQTLGISAAILSFASDETGSGQQSRHSCASLIGFEEVQAAPHFKEELLLFARQQWHETADASFRVFRMAEVAIPRFLPTALTTLESTGALLCSLFDHAAVMQVRVPTGTIRALLLREIGAGAFGNCWLALEAFAQMFAATAATRSAISNQPLQSEMLKTMLDQISLAIFLVDDGGRPIFCNEAANSLLERRDPLLRGCDGTLACHVNAESKQLCSAIQPVAHADHFREEVLRVTTRDGSARKVSIVPAPARTACDKSRCAMVVVSPWRACEAPEKFLSALGLLPSEQRFLNAFLHSSCITDAAARTGLSEETAHLFETHSGKARCPPPDGARPTYLWHGAPFAPVSCCDRCTPLMIEDWQHL